jgi:hypothetical protein
MTKYNSLKEVVKDLNEIIEYITNIQKETTPTFKKGSIHSLETAYHTVCDYLKDQPWVSSIGLGQNKVIVYTKCDEKIAVKKAQCMLFGLGENLDCLGWPIEFKFFGKVEQWN